MHMRVGRLISQWRLSGDYKYSPFFDPNTGAPHRSPAIALFPVRPDKGGRKGMA
jgi:hypothetical protein